MNLFPSKVGADTVRPHLPCHVGVCKTVTVRRSDVIPKDEGGMLRSRGFGGGFGGRNDFGSGGVGARTPHHEGFRAGSRTPSHDFGGSRTPMHEFGGSRTPMHEFGGSRTPMHEFGGGFRTPSGVHDGGYKAGSRTPMHEMGGGSRTPMHEFGGSRTPLNEFGG